MAQKKEKGIKPSPDPENREKQLVNLAVSLAEKQLLEGTASPSIINHYLKIASKRETLEREILEKQSKLMEAKTINITKDGELEQLSRLAIEAMKNYNSSSR